jgi:hypothetical protein
LRGMKTCCLVLAIVGCWKEREASRSTGPESPKVRSRPSTFGQRGVRLVMACITYDVSHNGGGGKGELMHRCVCVLCLPSSLSHVCTLAPSVSGPTRMLIFMCPYIYTYACIHATCMPLLYIYIYIYYIYVCLPRRGYTSRGWWWGRGTNQPAHSNIQAFKCQTILDVKGSNDEHAGVWKDERVRLGKILGP